MPPAEPAKASRLSAFTRRASQRAQECGLAERDLAPYHLKRASDWNLGSRFLEKRVEDGPDVGSLVAVKSTVSAWVLGAHLAATVYEKI